MNQVLEECVEKLEKHLQRYDTGALFVFCSGGVAYLNVRRGQIVFAFFQGCSGRDAIRQLHAALARTDVEVKTQFKIGPVSVVDDTLSATGDILKLLRSATAVEPPAPVESSPQSNRTTALLRDSDRVFLINAMTDLLGDEGSRICDDLLGKIKTLHLAVEVLADRLPDSAAAERFRAEMYPLLAEEGHDAVAPDGGTVTAWRPSQEVLLDDYGRALLLQCLAGHTTRLSDLDACVRILDQTDSLQVVIDHVLEHIPSEDESASFEKAFRDELCRARQHPPVTAVCSAGAA